MGWKDRFLRSRYLVNQSKALQKAKVEQIKKDRKATASLLKERKKAVRSLAPRVEKVIKQYNRAVKGDMVRLKPEGWTLGNAGWIVQMTFGGIKAEIWPRVQDKDKPRLLRGIWLHYLGPRGQQYITEQKVRGTKIGRSYELGTEEAYWKGHFYWIEGDTVTRPKCIFGYYIPIDDFNENMFATILEDIAYELQKIRAYFM